MYNLSIDAARAFKTRLAGIQIRVDLVSGKAIPDLNENDLKSLSIDRTGVSGKAIEIGAARAFELVIELENGDGRFKNINFDGAKLYAQTRIGAHTCPLGYFTVDGHENSTGSITLTALDRMVLFDKPAELPAHIFPITVKNLVLRACDYCGVDSSKLDLNSLCNAEYEVRNAPEGEPSWRTVIIWCAEILGACAFFDAEGYFRITWYEDTGIKITASDRFTHKIFENNVTVCGVEIIDTDKQSYIAGEIESGFYFSIEGNELITHDYEAVAAALGARLIGFTHRPFSATTLTMPNIFPLDVMGYVDGDGNELQVCVTSCEYTFNGNTVIEGAGESEVTKGFASLNQLTKQERAILAAALKKVTDNTRQELSEKQAALLRVNEVISNALGLYLIPVQDSADGSTQYYFTNAPTLETSSLIYVFNAGGFAWANKWGGSNKTTVWNYGITKEGNAVLNYLTVNKLTADQISVAEIVGAINASTGERILQIEADHIKVKGESLEVYVGGLVEQTGESENFAYSFKPSGLTLTANGADVLKVNKDGLIVNGTINAQGGTIAGLIIERAEISDDDTPYIQKSIRTPSDDFHILIKENETGNAVNSEIAITDLFCNTITAREGIGKIELNYHISSWKSTATLTTDSFIAGTSIFVTLTVSAFVVRDTVFSIEVKCANGTTFTRNVEITNGRYGIDVFYYDANIGFIDANFTDTGTKTKDFVTASEDDHYIGITESIIPTAHKTYNFGKSSRRWNEGYFSSLDVNDKITVGGLKVAVPMYSQTAKTGYVAYSNGNSYSSATWTDISGAQITSIYLANFRIITVRSYTTLDNDRWARIQLGDFCTKIYGVTVTASSQWGVSSLSGSKYGASFIIARSDDATTIYIGVDENTATGGFEATIIARV